METLTKCRSLALKIWRTPRLKAAVVAVMVSGLALFGINAPAPLIEAVATIAIMAAAQ